MSDKGVGRAGRRGRLVRAVSFLVALWLVTSCSAPGGDTYRIGVVVPLSGQSQSFGAEVRAAVDIGIDYANAHLGLRKRLEAVYADGQGQPAASVTAMNKAVNVDHSLAVITALSAVTKALAPIATRDKVPLLNGGASSPDLRGLGRYVFNNIPLAGQQVPVAADYLVRTRRLANWFVVYSDETLGQSMNAAIERDLPKAGGHLLGSIAVAQTATDFGPQVAKVREVNPQVVFVAMTDGNQVPVLARQLRQAGVHAQLVSYAGIAAAALQKEPAADGLLLTTQSVNRTAGDPLTRYFFTQYAQRRPHEEATSVQANYCSEVIVLATAIKSLEDKGEEVTGENVDAAINRIGRFDVVGGTLRFRPDGTADLPIDVVQMTNGKFTVVRPGT